MPHYEGLLRVIWEWLMPLHLGLSGRWRHSFWWLRVSLTVLLFSLVCLISFWRRSRGWTFLPLSSLQMHSFAFWVKALLVYERSSTEEGMKILAHFFTFFIVLFQAILKGIWTPFGMTELAILFFTRHFKVCGADLFWTFQNRCTCIRGRLIPFNSGILGNGGRSRVLWILWTLISHRWLWRLTPLTRELRYELILSLKLRQ